jgi:CBS domain-containing protein
MSKAHTPSPTVIAGLVAALRPHAPFSAMAASDLEFLVRSARLSYHERDQVIQGPTGARPDHMFVIREGTVRGERAGVANPLFEIGPGEMFPLFAVLGHRPATSVYRAGGDTFCLAVPVATFDALLARSPPLHDFCTRRLAYLLDLVRGEVQAEYAQDLTARRDMAAPLSSLARGEAVTATADTTLLAGMRTMQERRIGSLAVVDGEGRPVGMFTRADVIGRVVLPERSLDTPLREVMSVPALTLPAHATAADAAALMARRGVRHVVLTDADGRATGVVSERDLFALHRLSVRDIAKALARAPDVAALVRSAEDIRGLAHNLVAQGVASAALTRMISGLNDALTVRLLDIVGAEHGIGTHEYCWIGLGSEGRGEQTIATDQDNGIIFSGPPEETRQRLLPFARAVNAALDRCGYPLCKGGVMAGNEALCLSLPEWQAAFARWIDRGDPQSLLASSIFFDFRSLHGEAALAHELRADVAARAKATPRFLHQLAANACRNRPPLSWRGEVVDSTEEGIDLKMFGTMPITDGARVFALASGVTTTNTLERLREAGAALGMAAEDITNFCEAFEYLQMLRLRTQHRRAGGALAPSANANVVPVAALSALDRRVLKESLQQVRRVQQRLALDYP